MRKHLTKTGKLKLGMLQLAHKPLTLPGTLGNPKTFAFPLENRQVEGAWTSQVMVGDETVGNNYVSEAKQLESEGVLAIMANCGFAVVYQNILSNAVKVPVASSSMVQLPLLLTLIRPDKKVGILTFDAKNLTERHFSAAGVYDMSRIAVAGIEGSESYHILNDPEPKLTLEILEQDVLSCAKKLLTDHQDIGALLLECSAFCPFTDVLRQETGLMVLDFVTLGNFLMSAFGVRVSIAKPEEATV
jgi:hypothetical protein